MTATTRLDLPAAVATCLSGAMRTEPGALARCFAADATVRDEGRTIAGLPAIGAWHQASHDKYHHSVEPLAVARDGDALEVRARVTGNFPGSPIELRYRFTLRNDRIAALEIRS